MYQTTLFDEKPIECHHIVNVASVPQRSPFRYPGGKTWLVPQIRRWLKAYDLPPAYLLEPFAGGAIVSLTAAFEQLAKHIIMVEQDREVAAVWKTILDDGGEWGTTTVNGGGI
jgi:DNA adenine methylase